ncbi:MAG: hypothetical protein OXU20_13430 [Myxococcales bacterium]|nr:hypothetical protein [Myxococcales bacterium]MDD9965396.1 hypothetical protein [Myxococcales bacterium]
MSITDRVTETFTSHIQNNAYPGRGLVVGRLAGGDWVFVYWIMGRSENSRNRRFVVDGASLRTEPADVSKLQDPSLIIYEAMLEAPGIQLVSNGDQTRTALEALANGGTFEAAMLSREREPDAPNYTPRITAVLDFRKGAPILQLSLLKAGAFDPQDSDRYFFRPALPPPGFGFGITTYMGDGAPLPSFTGDPLVLPLPGNAAALLDNYYTALNPDNRIAVAVKRIDPQGRCLDLLVQNRF